VILHLADNAGHQGDCVGIPGLEASMPPTRYPFDHDSLLCGCDK